jgi:hypothetical protein
LRASAERLSMKRRKEPAFLENSLFIVEGKYSIFGSEGTKEEEMRTEKELFEGRSIFAVAEKI